MWMSLYILQEIQKINDDISGTRHDNLFRHVPIQKWDIKKPHPSRHHPRSPNTDYNKLKITFGAFVQVYIGTINSKKQRTVGAIALRPEN